MIRTLLLLVLLARAALLANVLEEGKETNQQNQTTLKDATTDVTNVQVDPNDDDDYNDSYNSDEVRGPSDANDTYTDTSGPFDYCSLNESCPTGTLHTMCQYKDETPGVKCQGPLDRTQLLTSIDKQKILEQHNAMRRKVSQGDVVGQPAAIQLEPLVWDGELEEIARRWAVQCMYVHATCRITRHGGYEERGKGVYGQNIGILAGESRFGNRYAAMVDKWFEEYKLFPEDEVAHISSNTEGASYTQIVWASTKRLGCERVVYHRSAEEDANDGGAGEGLTELLVCNYGPAGNWVGQQVYPKQVASQPRKLLTGGAVGRNYEIGSAMKTTCGGPVTTALCVLLSAVFQTPVY